MTNVGQVIKWISDHYGFPPPTFRLMCRDRCREDCSSLACYDPLNHQINVIAFDPPVELVAHEMGHVAYRFRNKCPPFGNNWPNPIQNEKFAREVETWASANMPSFGLDIDLGVGLLGAIGAAVGRVAEKFDVEEEDE